MPKMTKIKIIVCGAILSVLFVSKGFSMSFLSSLIKGKESDVVVFSPMDGVLTFNGEPASNAKISLWLKWNTPEGETKVYQADEFGQFSIPKVSEKYGKSALAQLVVTQEITVNYKNNDYLIWSISKSTEAEYAELGGKPVGLTCELTSEDKYHRTDDSLVTTKCEWERLEEIKGVSDE